MSFCIQCGKQNKDDAKFCTGCGLSLTTATDSPGGANPGSGSKSKNKWILPAGIFLLVALVASYFLFFKPKADGSGHEESSANSALPDTITKSRKSDTVTTNDPATVSSNTAVHDKKNSKAPIVITDERVPDISSPINAKANDAIMLDKMNVFYIGVDNPITILPAAGWDKTSVAITDGSMSGSGNTRVIRVSQVGQLGITMTAEGRSSKFYFRAKRIPDPIIKVGSSGGGRMPAAAFRAQQFVSAVLENFEFEAHYTVTGATIYFNNPGDRNVKQANLSSGSLSAAKVYLDTLVPGSTVVFDNIKVVGPDGQERTIQNPPGFSLY